MDWLYYLAGNGSHDFFHIFCILISLYYLIKNPQTTIIARTFLTHINSGISGVVSIAEMGMPELPDLIGKQTIDIDGRASYSC